MLAEKWKGKLGSELQLMMARVSGCTPEVLPREAGGQVSGSWPLQGGLKGLGKLRFRSTPAAARQRAKGVVYNTGTSVRPTAPSPYDGAVCEAALCLYCFYKLV
jgi:hypothetical protein